MRNLVLISSLFFVACNTKKVEPKPAPLAATKPQSAPVASAPSASMPSANKTTEPPRASLRFTKTGIGALHSNAQWTPERVAAALPGYSLNIKKDKTPDGFPFEEWKLMQGETKVAELLPHSESLLSASVYAGEIEGARVQPGGSFDALLGPSLSCQNFDRPDGALVCADDAPPPPAVVTTGPRALSYWILPTAGVKPAEGRFSPELLKGAKIAWVNVDFDGKTFPAPPTEAAAKALWAEDLVAWENLDKLWVGMEQRDIQERGDTLTESVEELAGVSCKKLESALGYRLWMAESGPMMGKVIAVEVWLLDGEEEHALSMMTLREAALGAALTEIEKLYADLGATRSGKDVRVGAENHWLSFSSKDGTKVDRIFIGRATAEWLDKR